MAPPFFIDGSTEVTFWNLFATTFLFLSILTPNSLRTTGSDEKCTYHLGLRGKHLDVVGIIPDKSIISRISIQYTMASLAHTWPYKLSIELQIFIYLTFYPYTGHCQPDLPQEEQLVIHFWTFHAHPWRSWFRAQRIFKEKSRNRKKKNEKHEIHLLGFEPINSQDR